MFLSIYCIYLQNKVLNPFEMTKTPVYLFNPEHDLALASGEHNYMPPASARRMAADLALLPIWYADTGSRVLAPSAYHLDYLKQMQQVFDLPVGLLTEPEVALVEYPYIRPWGWNVALRKRFLHLGVSETDLPDVEWLERLRGASHRSCAVALLPRLQLDDCFCGESSYLTSPQEWQLFVESHDACLLKAPLSGSGKGLNWCKGVYTPSISGWCMRIGSQQGGVVGEPIYNKVEDFAMEFLLSGEGGAQFIGYSQFRTNKSGAYEGNLLASDAMIELNLSAYIPVEELHRLREVLERELLLLLGDVYTGYLGIDMMICQFSDSPVYRIHPCVEINLRMNMGVVARLLYDRYVSPGATGVFQIGYYPEEGAAWREHERMRAEHPLVVKEGRVCSGYLPLVPVHKKSCYRSWMIVGRF